MSVVSTEGRGQLDLSNPRDVVAHARQRVEEMVRAECHGARGDTDKAMRKIADEHGVPFAALWSLRYRPPKDVYGSILFKIEIAYGAICEKQRNEYAKIRASIAPRGSISARLMRLADAAARKQAELVGGAYDSGPKNAESCSSKEELQRDAVAGIL